METIIYFQRKKGLKEPVIEPVGMKNHLLIRVTLDVDKEEWFGMKLEPPVQEDESAEDDEPIHFISSGYFGAALFHPLQALKQKHQKKKMLRQEKARRRAKELERVQLFSKWEERLGRTEEAVKKTVAEIMELVGEPEAVFCVYEDSVRRGLTSELRQEYLEKSLVFIWNRYFQVPVFSAYAQQFWIEQLMPRATLPHFVILGTTDCIFTVIEECAGRMKSLRWLLLESDCTPELLEFVEDFYTEYGLAIALQPLTDAVALKRLQLVCPEPANILDFTGETYVSVSEVAKGSIWLDVMSMEEKKRRIAGRNTGVVYFSLKDKWKRAQKRCNRPVLP